MAFLLRAVILSLFLFNSTYAAQFYLGVSGGYGSTNWQRTVDTDNDPSIQLSAPYKAQDSGAVYALLAGVNWHKYFGAQFIYARPSTAEVYFKTPNFYNNITLLRSKTYLYGLAGKLMVPLQDEPITLYSLLGAAYVYRKDTLAHKGKLGGLFGAGVDYTINQHFSAGFEFRFATGDAKVELATADTYVPFIDSYSITLKYYL